jgi:predicted PolB exonuclease-like 3'-5' exonuclease
MTEQQHTPPDLSSSDAIADYIQNRTAAWSQHLKRFHQKRQANMAVLGKSRQKSATKSRKK